MFVVTCAISCIKYRIVKMCRVLVTLNLPIHWSVVLTVIRA
jgi:hypothetical protein